MFKKNQPQSTLMDTLLHETKPRNLPKLGTLIEGQVIDIIGNKILVNINDVATGVITGKEARDSAETIKTLQTGDSISIYVIGDENEDGYYVLSLRRASQERTWQKFLKAYENNETIEAVITEANKGGLLVVMDGIKGFIPVSQLAPAHYPRVDDANSNEIFNRLKKLISQKLNVKILTINRLDGKLIFSEKAAVGEAREKKLTSLKVGDTVEGFISGIVKFGIFITFEGLEGLVHISEIEWGHVKDPGTYGKIGDKVKAKVIAIEGDKISLSMKQLTPDPWQGVAEKLTVGMTVKGIVDRITQFGVFLKLGNDLSGLIHLSELSIEPVKDPHKIVKLGETLEAKIIGIDIDDRRIGLSLKALQMPPAEDEKQAEKKEPENQKKEERKKTKQGVDKEEKASKKAAK